MAATRITPAPLTRPLSEIAKQIAEEWPAVKNEGTLDRRFGFNVGQHPANPYWMAMRCLPTTDLAASFGDDRAAHVVTYFLSNAAGWRGETARSVKAELQAALDHYYAEKRGAA